MGALNLEGGLLPILQGVITTFETVENTIFGFDKNAEQRQALQQLQERQNLQQQQSAQDVALERERITVQAEQDEEKRRAALRRAVARQRAQFGASGIGGQGGSADAVLLGLFEETDEELARREEIDNLRNRAIDLNAGQQRSLNVLQATQLAERQNLGRLF